MYTTRFYCQNEKKKKSIFLHLTVTRICELKGKPLNEPYCTAYTFTRYEKKGNLRACAER